MKRTALLIMVAFLLTLSSNTVLAKGGGGGHVSVHTSSHVSTTHTSTGGKTTSSSSAHSTSSSKASLSTGKSTTSFKTFNEAFHYTPTTKYTAPSYTQFNDSNHSSWPLIMRQYYFVNTNQPDEEDDQKDK